VLGVLVERVGTERLLEADELGRVLHERDEEQAAEQRSGLRVDAVGEGVPAAQDPGPAVVLEAGQPDVRVGRDRGIPSLPVAAKSGVVNSFPPDSGAPETLTRPMVFSWSCR
jgi:hypothetical protein